MSGVDTQEMAREGLSDAEICRRCGWGPGTVLEGDEGYGPVRIRITAIGEESILARSIPAGSELTWTLSVRAWREVVDYD